MKLQKKISKWSCEEERIALQQVYQISQGKNMRWWRSEREGGGGWSGLCSGHWRRIGMEDEGMNATMKFFRGDEDHRDALMLCGSSWCVHSGSPKRKMREENKAMMRAVKRMIFNGLHVLMLMIWKIGQGKQRPDCSDCLAEWLTWLFIR